MLFIIVAIIIFYGVMYPASQHLIVKVDSSLDESRCNLNINYSGFDSSGFDVAKMQRFKEENLIVQSNKDGKNIYIIDIYTGKKYTLSAKQDFIKH